MNDDGTDRAADPTPEEWQRLARRVDQLERDARTNASATRFLLRGKFPARDHKHALEAIINRRPSTR